MDTNNISNSILESINRILSSWSEEKLADMKAILRSEGKIAKGILISEIKIQIEKDKKAMLVYPIEGKYVDEGRKPGEICPPFQL